MGLRNLPNLRPIYFLPEDDLVGQVLVPALREAQAYDCMIGFFHSSSLREMAPGLAEFLGRPVGTMRLAVSPYLSEEDQEAIRLGSESEPEVLARRLEELYGSAKTDSGALVQHTLACLAYLIASHRIEIKVVLVKGGLFHPKIRILSDGSDSLAVHGSNNLTLSGLTTNFEQITVSRSWGGADQELVVRRLESEFKDIWTNNKGSHIRAFDFPQALRERIIKEYGTKNPPTPADFWEAWNTEGPRRRRSMDPPADRPQRVFSIPSGVQYQEGDFAHQGQAIEAWEAAGRRGVLEMATGSGKTITALIAARRLADWVHPLLITVAVPYLPLVSQWADAVKAFGLEPIIPGGATRRADKLVRVSDAARKLKLGVSDVECLVITHDLLCDVDFQAAVRRHNVAALLIADEVHHLGAPGFRASPPDSFQYRIGLSATPTRQYDEAGTAELFAYFGDVVFQFTLEQAIGTCLVPYDYYLHEVQLTEAEVEEWLTLTEQLRKRGWKFTQEEGQVNLPPDIQRLLIRRRFILEQASNKLAVLKDVLQKEDLRSIRHTLIYASDKGREQLENVNRLLMEDLKLRIHQVTQEETSNGRLAQHILDNFARGDSLQVLTAMRVLDEGLDIPEVSTAYILSSTTLERQWVQRRGRILRKSPRTGKQFAVLHDFVVVPPSGVPTEHLGHDATRIVEMELKRVLEFAKTSRNASSADGALITATRIIEAYL